MPKEAAGGCAPLTRKSICGVAECGVAVEWECSAAFVAPLRVKNESQLHNHQHHQGCFFVGGPVVFVWPSPCVFAVSMLALAYCHQAHRTALTTPVNKSSTRAGQVFLVVHQFRVG